MSRTSQTSRRGQVDLRFIIADPSSDDGKRSNLHIVRSHAGKWRWSEARKKKYHGSQEKSEFRDNALIGFSCSRAGSSSEEPEASDSSIFDTPPSEYKDSSPDDDLNHLIDAIGEKPYQAEMFIPEDFVPGNFGEIPFEEMHSTCSGQMWESNWPDYCHSEGVDLYGISPSMLNPFQSNLHTSPSPSELVSNTNKYCKIPRAYSLSLN